MSDTAKFLAGAGIGFGLVAALSAAVLVAARSVARSLEVANRTEVGVPQPADLRLFGAAGAGEPSHLSAGGSSIHRSGVQAGAAQDRGESRSTGA